MSAALERAIMPDPDLTPEGKAALCALYNAQVRPGSDWQRQVGQHLAGLTVEMASRP